MSVAVALCCAAAGASATAPSAPAAGSAPGAAYRWNLPPGFPPPAVPAANPMSAAKVELGRRLFFDTRLSLDGSYACASCHRPELAFTDGRLRSIGATGGVLMRQAMGLNNVAYAVSLGWTQGGAASLEAQMLTPLFNRHPVELGLSGRVAGLLRLLAADPTSAAAFAQAFPSSPAPSLRKIIDSVACYERSLFAGSSAFDRYVFQDQPQALSAAAKRGMALFFGDRLGCSGCHFGINFAGPAALAGQRRPAPLFADTATQGRFKIPSLRNLAVTAPYMHDGRFADLAAVIDHYEHLQRDRAPTERLDPRLRQIQLDPDERRELTEFLLSLSDS